LPNKKLANYLRKPKKLIFLNNICLTSILQNFSIKTEAGIISYMYDVVKPNKSIFFLFFAEYKEHCQQWAHA